MNDEKERKTLEREIEQTIMKIKNAPDELSINPYRVRLRELSDQYKELTGNYYRTETFK